MQSLRELRRLCLVGLPASVLWAGDGPSTRPAAPSNRGDATASIEGQVVVSRALTARRPRFRIYAEPGPGAVPPAPEAAPPDQTNPIEPALADAGEPETSLKPELDSISDFSPAWPEEPAPTDYVDAESLDSDPQPPPFELQELEDVDLTQYSESRFTAGITSHGGPLGS